MVEMDEVSRTLDIHFDNVKKTSLINGIEIIPVGAVNIEPITIDSGSGNDKYFVGGGSVLNESAEIYYPQNQLYSSHREGNLNYEIDVSNGTYLVNLTLSSKQPSGWSTVESSIEVECGGQRFIDVSDSSPFAIQQTFLAIVADGKLNVTFGLSLIHI